MQFTTDGKLRACAAFVATLYSTAGCTPAEIKRLLSPKLIDAYIEAARRQRDGGQ